MSDLEIKNIFSNSKILKSVFNQIELEKKIYIKGLSGSMKALFLSILADEKKAPIIYITGEDDQEEVVKEDLEVLLGNERVAYFPKIRELADSEVIFDSTKKSQLQLSLEKIIERKNVVAVLSAKNITHRFPSPEVIKKQRLFLKINTEYNFELLKERLADLGFDREDVVENGGEISVRGGIIDIYPYSSDYPYRIEFFGDLIESIRIFDPTTQRSIKQVPQLTIYPQYPEEQKESGQAAFVSLLDYFNDKAVIFLDETALIQKEIKDFFQIKQELSEKQSLNDRLPFEKKSFFSWEKIQTKLDNFSTIIHDSFLSSGKKTYFDFSSQLQESLRGNLQLLKKKISFFHKQKLPNSQSYKICFLCDSSEQIERMADLFQDAEINLEQFDFLKLGLNQGFIFNDAGLVVFTDNQFYGRPIRWRRRKRTHRGLTLKQLNSLSIGDFVVHVDKGIGKSQGLKKITVAGHERECLSVIYQNGDLYVPLERMDRIQKYSAKDGVVPVLCKLGSKNWELLKKRTKKRIKELAKELTVLYAKRKTQRGYAFSKDTLWQKELEASFEFEDTPDQIKATAEIKFDMENDYPMDRLVCGDVGYGKTEVAVRAAFKAVNEGKQVSVLVPTTILALQHYEVFRDRLRNYPIKVEMLSRFRTHSEQKRIVNQLKKGELGVVVGTHRLLSKDVSFKDIGLLVIDEEHRFGVKKKESLKERYVNVDVLSMSATPIPRTLNMALLGIRDMSLITTPPRDRHPIYTEVTPFDIDLIRMAILKEVDRGGQIFFVHNRVQTIESIASLIRRTVLVISVAVAHGQMDERQLEKVMWDFATKKSHCLISTMIIESGLDIPNVNTMIINRADRFGLSQLYQLRGRVGRSDTRAYAYLLVPPITSLNKNVLKRLRIIEEFTDLGSGFNIAMRDLEIRGAGNILGAEQSGHIVALGYELYTKIIEEAVQELKFEQEGKQLPETEKQEEIKVDIAQDAYFPDDYIEQPE
ncbi:MAG: transcription-repair coupling factor, partial [Bacteroidales bacterium]|nr:transcription-repair coupling factor [Bacteroidales bacterium]